MAYEISSFDNRRRVVALQATAHACVAAAAADVIGELFLMPGVGAGQVQWDLIRELGGLQHAGTTFVAAAHAIKRRFGKRLVVEAALGVGWEQALNAQAPHLGVVVALSNPGTSEGHAVRILGSSRPLHQPGEGSFADLLHPRPFTDLVMKVQLFDPWPNNPAPVRLERHGEVRARFESAGGQCLLIGRRQTSRS